MAMREGGHATVLMLHKRTKEHLGVHGSIRGGALNG